MPDPQTRPFGDRRLGEYSFREHLELIRTRPGMYGLNGSYRDFVTYLYGYDAGTRDSALLGFREWLLLRLARQSSLVWPSLVLTLAVPAAPLQHDKALSEPQNSAAVVALFELLETFLNDRDGDRHGLRKIFSNYDRRFVGLIGPTAANSPCANRPK
jgi:hypothetical protein